MFRDAAPGLRFSRDNPKPLYGLYVDENGMASNMSTLSFGGAVETEDGSNFQIAVAQFHVTKQALVNIHGLMCNLYDANGSLLASVEQGHYNTVAELYNAVQTAVSSSIEGTEIFYAHEAKDFLGIPTIGPDRNLGSAFNLRVLGLRPPQNIGGSSITLGLIGTFVLGVLLFPDYYPWYLDGPLQAIGGKGQNVNIVMDEVFARTDDQRVLLKVGLAAQNAAIDIDVSKLVWHDMDTNRLEDIRLHLVDDTRQPYVMQGNEYPFVEILIRARGGGPS